MIFLNPWAWLGLAAIAGPILAHLLARRSARRQLFPNLRFLPAGIQRPVSPSRLTNLGLLVLRIGIIALAAFALAQPVWLSPARVDQLGRQIARAIVVDTSASMSSAQTAGGRAVLEAARAEAARIAADATASRVVETDSPSTTVGAALIWLSTQPMRRELVVVSDFQTGTIARTDIDRVPANVGVQLVQIARTGPLAAEPRRQRESVTLLSGSADHSGAEAARQAATSQGAPDRAPASRPVAILFQSYEVRDALLKDARAIDQTWMFDVIDRVSRDALLRAESARLAKPVSQIASALACRIDGVETLMLVTSEPAASVAAAALIAAAARAAADDASIKEQSTEFLPADELRSWNRSPADRAPAGDGVGAQESYGRWIWMGVLGLIAVETLVRQRRRRDASTDQDAIAA